MRVLTIATVSVCLLLSPSCSKKAFKTPPSADKQTSPSVATAEGSGTTTTGDTVTAKPPAESPSGEKSDQPSGEPTSVLAAASGNTVPSAVPTPTDPGKAPLVSEAECKKACSHATKLSMDSLPADATDEMKTAILKALEDECPKNCVAKGTPAMIACILAAQSGMDLAACPK